MLRTIGTVAISFAIMSRALAQDDRLFTIKNDLSLTVASFTVGNMPYAIRNVPPHPDDASFANPGAISNLEYSSTSFQLTYGYAVWQARSKNQSFAFRIRAGLYMNNETFSERDYLGNPDDVRGTGTALTFLFVRPHGLLSTDDDFNIGDSNVATNIQGYSLDATPELCWGIRLNRASSLLLSVSCEELEADTGWDRYNSQSVNARYQLAMVFPISLSYCWKSSGDGNMYELGAVFFPMTETTLGKQAGISSTVGLVLGATF